VLSTVQLDNQPAVRASEIGDIPADRVLATELESGEPPISQVLPQSFLSLRLVTPEPASEPDL